MDDLASELSYIQEIIQNHEETIEELKMDIGTDHEYFIMQAEEGMKYNITQGDNDPELNEEYKKEIKHHKTQIKLLKDQIKVLEKQLSRLYKTQQELIIKLGIQQQGFGRRGIRSLRKKTLRSMVNVMNPYVQGAMERIRAGGMQIRGMHNLTTTNAQIRELERISTNLTKTIHKKRNLAHRFEKRYNKEVRRGNNELADRFLQKQGYTMQQVNEHKANQTMLEDQIARLIARREGVTPFDMRFRTNWE